MKEYILNGIFALLGSGITILGTFLANRNSKKQEQNRRNLEKYLKEIKAFYNLEQLYIKAVSELRSSIPDNKESANIHNIKNEFRRENEKNGNVLITMTDTQVEKELKDL